MTAAPSRPLVDGLVLAPLRALRYDTSLAGDLADLTSPPYDVIDEQARGELEARSEHNVVRLILPREPSQGSGTRYEHAARLLERWRSQGVLRPDPRPGLYVYEQADATSGHVQRGLLGALALPPADAGIVLPHENTMAGPVSDRLALYQATGADLEPIFLLYEGGGLASEAVRRADQAEPLVDAPLPDGLRHRLWALTDPELLAGIAADLHPRRALIADGHHRYATYLQRQEQQWASGAGAGPWDRGLTFLVDATAFGPQVHPIHRVIPGQPAALLAERAGAGMTVTEVGGDPTASLPLLAERAGRGPAYLLSDGDRTWLLSHPDPQRLAASLPESRSRAWRDLDVSVLHGFVVPQLWQLPDDVATVGYEHDVAAAVSAARASRGAAVLLNATPVDAVTAVAAAGERMPRKSTLFTPKPRTGLVIRDYRDC